MPEELKPKPTRPVLKKPEPLVELSLSTTPPSPSTTLPKTTNPKDLDRSRAMHAWNSIQSVKCQTYKTEYGRLARKIPTLIQVNGLAQTLAFFKAKGKENDPKSRKEQFVQVFNHLSEWICNNRLEPGTGDLLDRVLQMDSNKYRFVTNEALAFLQWLKRFAEAELGSEDEK